MNAILYAEDVLHFNSQVDMYNHFASPASSPVVNTSSALNSIGLTDVLLISAGVIAAGCIVYLVIQHIKEERSRDLQTKNGS